MNNKINFITREQKRILEKLKTFINDIECGDGKSDKEHTFYLTQDDAKKIVLSLEFILNVIDILDIVEKE